MNWTLFWVFIATETLLILTPGPAVLTVLSTAMRWGTPQGAIAILGICAANGAYFALSATTVGALLLKAYNVFFAIKWLGAAYLAVLGLRALLAAGKASPAEPGSTQSGSRTFTRAFLVQTSNPKAIVFFAALLPQFLDPAFPVARQILVLGTASILLEFALLLVYAALAGRGLALVREGRYGAWIERASGLVLIGAGVGLALLSKE